MNTEVEDLTIVDGVKLIVGKTYLIQYAHGRTPNKWRECKITRITPHGHAWGEGEDIHGIVTKDSYNVQTIPYVSGNLSIELYKLQEGTIGLFRPHASEVIEMVVKKDGGLLKTISIGHLGGLTTSFTPVEKGVFHEFSGNRTLADMLNNVYELNEICKSLKK